MSDNFSNLKDILGNVHFQNISPLYGLIISDWNNILGKKFENKSEVVNFFNKGTKSYMLVHVFSSSLVQELQFLKLNIIKKIEKKYNLKIDDIIIKVANKNSYNKNDIKHDVVRESYNIRPTSDELNKIILADETVNKIKLSVSKQSTLSDEKKQRMFEVIINDLKTQEWMKQKGFPVCEICGCVITEKNFGEKNICKFCKNSQKSI